MSDRMRRTLGVVVPLAIALLVGVGGALLIWSIRGELPERIATHWGASGRSDGFSTLGELMGMGIGLTVGMTVFLTLVGLGIKQPAAMGATSAGTATFMGVLMYGSAYAQRGLTDASEVRLGNSLELISLGVALVVALAVGLLLRRPAPKVPPRDHSPAAHTPGSLTREWTGPVRRGTAGIVLLSVVSAATVVFGFWMWRSSGSILVLIIGVLVLGLLPLMFMEMHVDRDGIRLTVMDRFVVRRIPLEHIVSAEVRQVSCMGDYGGFGLRGGFDGSWGVVTSDGEAVRITRHDQSDFVVTIDDAHAAASTINSLVGA